MAPQRVEARKVARNVGTRPHAPADARQTLWQNTQVAALEQWNSEPRRPPWDHHGHQLAHCLHAGALNVDRLFYLSDAAKARIRSEATQDRGRREVERDAIAQLRDLALWHQQAKAVLARVELYREPPHPRKHEDYAMGMATRQLREVLDGPPFANEEIGHWRSASLFRTDALRSDL